MSQISAKKNKKSPRERFQSDNTVAPKNRNKALMVLPLLLGIILVGLFSVSILFGNNKDNNPIMKSTPDIEVTHPVAQFSDGKARHFEYTTDDGIPVRYFVLKSTDGIIRAAFDACDVCWPANKGYYQEGDYMVCRNCGRKFASVKVNEVKGGCNPAPLARQQLNDNIVIKVTDIVSGKRYFNFSSGGGK